MEFKFRIWDIEARCYRYPEPEGDLNVLLGSRYVWAPFFFKANSPLSNYVLEVYTGKKDIRGQEIYEKVGEQ